MCLIKYDQDINPQTYVYLIFLKEARNMHWKKDSILNKSAGQIACLPVEELK